MRKAYDVLLAEYEVSGDVLERDILRLVTELSVRGLVTVTPRGDPR